MAMEGVERDQRGSQASYVGVQKIVDGAWMISACERVQCMVFVAPISKPILQLAGAAGNPGADLRGKPGDAPRAETSLARENSPRNEVIDRRSRETRLGDDDLQAPEFIVARLRLL